jgi:hypothetical protein
MILRRFMQHVKDQNWFAVWLDLGIVVLGIVIGFQVTDWNQGRSERSSEANHLAYLVQDLTADIEELTYIEEMTLRRLSALDAVIVEATGAPTRLVFDMPGFQVNFQPAPALENPAECSVIYATTTMSTLDGNRHAYNTLINTGDVQLLSNTSHVRAIQGYYANADEVRDMELIMMRFRDDMWRSMHRLGISRQDCMSFAQFSEIAANDPQLLAEIRDVWNLTQQQRDRIVALREHGEAVRDLIRETA